MIRGWLRYWNSNAATSGNLRGPLPSALHDPDYSQLPVSRWSEQVGDPTLADGILGRLGALGSPLRSQFQLLYVAVRPVFFDTSQPPAT